MTRLLAYLLTVLLLLQSFGRELLVLHFKANQTELAARYCVNKARPRLHCDGRCYLMRQIRRAERGPAKAPGAGLAKVKFEVVAPTRLQLAAPAWAGRPAPRPTRRWRWRACFIPPPYKAELFDPGAREAECPSKPRRAGRSAPRWGPCGYFGHSSFIL